MASDTVFNDSFVVDSYFCGGDPPGNRFVSFVCASGAKLLGRGRVRFGQSIREAGRGYSIAQLNNQYFGLHSVAILAQAALAQAIFAKTFSVGL